MKRLAAIAAVCLVACIALAATAVADISDAFYTPRVYGGALMLVGHSSTVRQQYDGQNSGVAVNHGSLSADATNSMGRITGIGANGSVTLTFGTSVGTPFSSIAHCFVQVISGTYTSEGYQIKVTASSAAPVFSCYSSSIAGNGSTASCPDLEYFCMGN